MMRVNKHHGQASKNAAKASRTISRVVFMRDIYKRLETMVAARRQDEVHLTRSGNTIDIKKRLEVSEPQPAAKLLVATKQFAALAASVERRPEAYQAKMFLSPLIKAIAAAKVAIRRKQGMQVNKNLQRRALHLVLDSAEACERAISMAIATGEKDPAWPTVHIADDDKSSALSDSTRSISSQSGPPSLPSDSGRGSSVRSAPFSPRVGRQRKHRPRCAPVSPGAMFVRGRRPSVRVDPRASNLSGTGAICR